MSSAPTPEEHLTCGICTSVFYNPIEAQPCAHIFCSACLREWMVTAKDCPLCRAPIVSVHRNSVVDNLLAWFLQEHPEAGPAPEDQTDHDVRIVAMDAAEQEAIRARAEVEDVEARRRTSVKSTKLLWDTVKGLRATAPRQIPTLVAKGADLTSVDPDWGHTPLHAAVKYCQSVVEDLLAAGASTDARNHSGSTALHLCMNPDGLAMAELLIDAGASVNITDCSGDTPLCHAMSRGLLQIAGRLIAAGANVNTQNQAGVSPLHRAAQNGDVDGIRMLVTAHANVNARDTRGKTPLYLARRADCEAACTTLLAAGAEPCGGT